MYNTGLLAKRVLVLLTASYLGAQAPDEQSLPVATQWSMDAAGESGRAAIRSVVKIACSKAQTVGTGFQLDTGFIVTNAHVVGPCGAPDLLILSSDGGALSVSNLIIDPERDLAALRLSKSVETVGLKIHRNINPKIGDQFSTWGYPFGIPGPAPLWTFGYLSGFTTTPTSHGIGVKHFVITGAFNPGNSGGPLLADGAVAGVVVSKRLFSLPPFLASALTAMANNRTGVAFEATDGTGKKIEFLESQLTAELLKYYRDVSQVFIGEAIAANELTAFLDAHQIPWSPVAHVTPKKK